MPDPPLARSIAGRFVFHHTRRERFRSKWQIIADPHRPADKFDVAPESFRGHIHCVVNQPPARVHIRAITQIKCVTQPNRVYQVRSRSKKEIRPDLRISDVYTPKIEDQRGVIVFGDLAAEFQSCAQFEFCVAVVIESEGRSTGFENEICVEKERILVQDVASIAALRDLDHDRARTASAEQVSIANLRASKCALISVESNPKAEFLAFGFLR